MRNFLIFLSILVVVILAATDAKQRLEELDKMSKYRQTVIEQVGETQEKPEIITDNIKANNN